MSWNKHEAVSYAAQPPAAGTTNMKDTILILFIFSSSAMVGHSDLLNAFNSWYVNQINKDAFPITDGNEIDKYVTVSTMKNPSIQDPRYATKSFTRLIF
jgi:hypothetical protein